MGLEREKKATPFSSLLIVLMNFPFILRIFPNHYSVLSEDDVVILTTVWRTVRKAMGMDIGDTCTLH